MQHANVARYASYRISTRSGSEVGALGWHDDNQVIDYARRILRSDLNAPLVVTRLQDDGSYVEVGRVE